MLNGLTLHHLGVATRSIERELPCYEALGYRAVSDPFTDAGQGIRGLFVKAQGQPTLELLENLGPSGPLDDCLARGIKIYHFSYETTDIDAALKALAERTGAKVIVPVTEASYFHRVCFVMLPNMLLVELVQEPRAARFSTGC